MTVLTLLTVFENHTSTRGSIVGRMRHFSRNKFFAQLCCPLEVINQLATTHRVQQVKSQVEKKLEEEDELIYSKKALALAINIEILITENS